MNKVELLAPAGDMSKLNTAFKYGADAAYIGGEEFSLRCAANNFSIKEMHEAIELAHGNNKKLYLTANIIGHNNDIREYEKYLNEVKNIPFDGIIVSDIGMFDITKQILPDTDIHISTQANNTNYASANMWHKLGAKRIILARELSFEEIEEVRSNTPLDLELEAFVHGAMCISYSGRCLLSNYMTNRDSNRGECAQPCRWNYYLMEEQRPGEYMNVYENERGTYIYNSKDLCMVEHVDKLIECGLSSLKIEGRVKNEFYIATVVNVYRDAIDTYYKNPNRFKVDPEWMNELRKVSHRDYTTGFYFSRPNGKEQNYESSSYIREYDLAGIVTEYDEESSMATVVQKNRFFKGDTVEFLRPFGKFFTQIIDNIFDMDGNEVEIANKPQTPVKIKTINKVEVDSIMRKQKK